MELRVGLIGLGQMGRAIARRLLAGEYPLALYNRTASKAEPFIQQGARRADSPKELAAVSDAVITMVSDNAALEAMALGPDGAAAGLGEGAVLIDMSTLTTGVVERVAAAVSERGAAMLHAPILGGPMNIYVGNATITVGGPDDLVLRMRPLLEAISKPVLHVGPLTNGTRMKMALNIVLTHLLMGISSSLAFAGLAQLDQQQILDIFSRSAGQILKRMGEKMISDETGVTFTIRNLEKDQRYFLSTAGELGLKLPTVEAAHKLFKKAVKKGLAEEDYTEIYRFIFEQSGKS